MLDQDPEISEKASKTFKERRSLRINRWIETDKTTEFDTSESFLGKIDYFKYKGEYYTYTGMLNKKSEPHGIGRAIKSDR
jgi:hypothetical protein